ncbi:MAG: RAMP superfamily CRISPR-associated protein [Paraglaciecola sp.]|nr:RAMP superfamily CRISPR-associated protein [Paraglaciecola sp.]
MSQHLLELDFNYYWHSGSGSGSGTHLDALTEKDRDFLPFVSGKHLKGLLRHALHRAEAWGWLEQSLCPGLANNWETLIFGSANQQSERNQTLPGMLFVNDATLAESERQWLNSNSEAKPFLYHELYTTAINPDTGSALDHSLRGLEVCLPLKLFAQLELATTASEPNHRQQQTALLALKDPFFWLPPILSLVDSVGAHRTRGLGEVKLSIVNSRN